MEPRSKSRAPKHHIRQGLILLLLAAGAVMVGIGTGLTFLHPKPTPISTGTLLPKPRTIAPFKLTGDDGQAFTNADFNRHWTLIFAGYTFCPDVCPTTLTELKATVDRLGAAADRLRVLFISVDPERDKPERLSQYVHAFSPEFRAATGEVPALEALGTSLGFVFTKVPGATPETYLIDHSAALMLINPHGELAGYLTPPFKAEAMAADLRPLLPRDR